MALLLPQSLVAEAENAAREMASDAALENAIQWTEELKKIDWSLSVVFIGENSEVGNLDLMPGRWHIRKKIPGGSDEYMILAGPEGEYREPGSWMLDQLNATDMWNPRVHRNRKEAKRKLREAKERAKVLDREQRRDEMLVGAKAALRMRGDSGMYTRTDRKRRGEGIKKPEKKLIIARG